MSPPPASAWLIDQLWLKAYPIADEATIGRGADSTIILRDAAVSRHHASVRREPAGYVLHALGRATVTVNGVPVGTECLLAEGDLVGIAFTTFRFSTRPPTSDMMVIPRDTPSLFDRVESPTRATIQAIAHSGMLDRTRRLWQLAAVVFLVLFLVIFLLAARPLPR